MNPYIPEGIRDSTVEAIPSTILLTNTGTRPQRRGCNH